MSDEAVRDLLCRLPIWDQADKLQARLEQLQWKASQLLEKCSELAGSPTTLAGLDTKATQNGNNHLVSSDPPDSIGMLSSIPQVGEEVFAMDNPGKPWFRCQLKAVYRQVRHGHVVTIFKMVRKSDKYVLRSTKYHVARLQNHGTQLRVSKRVIAGPDEDHLLPGIIAQECCQQNKNRYLVLLDDGSANYYHPTQVYPIVYQTKKPWADQGQCGTRNEDLTIQLTQYFKQYPRRNVIQVTPGQKLDVRKNRDWVEAFVVGKECDVLRLLYSDRTEEFVYRGSSRFIKKIACSERLLVNSYAELNNQLVKNIDAYHQAGKKSIQEDDFVSMMLGGVGRMNICGNTARKSTATRNAPPRLKVASHPHECPSLFFQSRRERIPDISEFPAVNHRCSPECLKARGSGKSEADVDIIKDFYEVSDLKVPLILGWKRILVLAKKSQAGKQPVFAYEAPCGKMFTMLLHVRRYLQVTNSKLDIDYFTTDKDVNLSRTLDDRLAYYYEANLASKKDTGEPIENKYVSVINVVNQERLASDFIYNSERFPHRLLEANGFSFNEEFKSGCDCDDDCFSRVNCPCHQLNEELAGGIGRHRGNLDTKYQYREKRLYDQVSTGIFECNSFCSCSSKCSNRVVQNGIRIRLQVRKTINKGWGVFTLDDVPKGTFICTYAAEILDDADQYGDSDIYFADLDYMTVLEQQKLALSDNEDDEGIDEEEVGHKRPHRLESSSDEDSELALVNNEFLPRADPSGFIKIHTLLNESQDYTLDARLQGNVGRFFNHSCDPNTYVQNVFIESHDPRFPHVAFFTKKNLQADDEITWNYNYKVDSIVGRHIDCNCGASNCKGRIL